MNRDTERTQEDYILELCELFKYSETIGQNRLYNFLMSASILLLACSTLMQSCESYRVTVLLSATGVLLSFMWFIQGTRQAKFHKIIEDELHKLLAANANRNLFGYALIDDMKKNRLMFDKKYRLNQVECFFSSRKFLTYVPALFAVSFFLVSIFSVFCQHNGYKFSIYSDYIYPFVHNALQF